MHIVYKTTNLVNNKFYLGVHDTSRKNDKTYLGSGIVLKQAIKKYGKSNFIRETLMEFNTSEEAYDYEEWLVNDYMINRPDCYNRIIGGQGQKPGYKHTNSARDKMTNRLNEYYASDEWQNNGRLQKSSSMSQHYDTVNGKLHLELTQTLMKDRWENNEEYANKMRNLHNGRKRTEETKRKIRNAQLSLPLVTCPHCKKSGQITGMKRYHFDNCKYIKENQ